MFYVHNVSHVKAVGAAVARAAMAPALFSLLIKYS